MLSAAHAIPLLGGAGAHKPRGETKSPDEDDAPVIVHGIRLDIALWPPPKQQDHAKAQQRQAHERPFEGVIISVANKNSIAVLEGRNTKISKFGGRDGTRGSPPWCPERTVERRDVDSDSDVDHWDETNRCEEGQEPD